VSDHGDDPLKSSTKSDRCSTDDRKGPAPERAQTVTRRHSKVASTSWAKLTQSWTCVHFCWSNPIKSNLGVHNLHPTIWY